MLAICAAKTAVAAEGLRLDLLTDADIDRTVAHKIVDAPLAVSSALVLSAVMALATGAVVAGWRLRHQRDQTSAALVHATRRFDQLAEQTSDIVVRFSGQTYQVSSSVLDVLGYAPEDVERADLARLVHVDDLQRVEEAYASLDGTCQRRDLNFRLIHRDTSVIWVEATFVRLDPYGMGAPETICTIRDVTRRSQETDELHMAMQAAREAHAEADEANRAKSEFLASMSHEVRTPLNAILGFADLILAMPDLPGTGRRHAERIRGGGDALLKIVDDILDLSKAEAGALQLDPRPFSLPLLVDECLSLVEHAALAKNLSLRVDLADRFPTGLVGDDGRLRQILLNLLNNAIKFTRLGNVTLRIRYDSTRGPSAVRFEVSDTGIGIAAEDLPRLFQRFRQVDGSIRRTFGGTGLGLAICKTLVERMGGSIGVESETGAGSTFWFAIDLPTTPLVLEPFSLASPQARRVLDLLLVEDVVVNQELACAILRAKGHRVDVVADGAEAIMAAADKPYDLVFMDVQMPYVDGLTATRAIRNLPTPSRFVPIVAMTAAVLSDQVAAAGAAGMDDVLAKPLSIPALDALLERAERDAVREPVDPDAFDPTVVAKLAAAIGESKVAAMQSLLARSLTARLAADPERDNLADLKAEAHASIAGAGMLGFTRFGSLCRAFIATADLPAARDAFARLRRELYQVVRTLEVMAENDGRENRRVA